MPPGPPIVTITMLGSPEVVVQAQFNPASLQITHQVKADTTSSQRNGKNGTNEAGSVNQRTGMETKLSSIELIFDTTRDGSDVRVNTLKLAHMIHKGDKSNEAPIVQFQWGTLLFKGTIDSLTETLDYFSELGVPLRATVAMQMTMTPDEKASNDAQNGLSATAGAAAGFSAGFGAGVSASAGISASAGFSAGAAVGTTGLTLAQSGESLQAMSARAGLDWKAVAAANGIDNPRFLQAGAVVNLNASASAKVTFNS